MKTALVIIFIATFKVGVMANHFPLKELMGSNLSFNDIKRLCRDEEDFNKIVKFFVYLAITLLRLFIGCEEAKTRKNSNRYQEK